MMGELDSLDFRVAETCGMSLGAVRALPNAEIVQWGAYFEATDALEDMHARADASRRRR